MNGEEDRLLSSFPSCSFLGFFFFAETYSPTCLIVLEQPDQPSLNRGLLELEGLLSGMVVNTWMGVMVGHLA